MSLPLPSKGAWLDRIPIPAANSHGKLPILITASLFILVLVSLTFLQNKSKYPLVNGPSWFQLRLFKQLDFIQNGMEIFERSRKRFAGKPFRMLTEVGEVIVLPPSYAHDIRNEPGLSFGKAIAQVGLWKMGHSSVFSPLARTSMPTSQALSLLALAIMAVRSRRP